MPDVWVSFAFMAAATTRLEFGTAIYILALRHPMVTASAIATQQCIVSFGTTDFRADLRGITIPTLIVHGDADRIVPFPLSGARTHAMIPSSQLEVLQGAPHGFVATHAAQLNRRLVSFLRS